LSSASNNILCKRLIHCYLPLDLESMEILRIKPFDQFGSPVEIIKSFGGKKQYVEAVKELEKQIYEVAA